MHLRWLGLGLTTLSRKKTLVFETANQGENQTDSTENDLRTRKRILTWKNTKNFGTWNLRTINRSGAVEELEKEMINYRMQVCALQEIRWTGVGSKDLKEGRILYSGRKDGKHREGTGFYVRKALINDIIEFEAISSRIARLRLRSQWLNVTIISVHAPTDVSLDQQKDEWYGLLEQVLDKIPGHDLLIVAGLECKSWPGCWKLQRRGRNT